jgi:hypothetical protein
MTDKSGFTPAYNWWSCDENIWLSPTLMFIKQILHVGVRHGRPHLPPFIWV